MVCNKCNHKLPDDSEFCQYCGNKIEQGFVISTEVSKEPNTVEPSAVIPVASVAPVAPVVEDEPSIDEMNPDEALNAMLKMLAQDTIEAMEANSKTQPDNENDSDFGLIPEKPIFTFALMSVDGEKEYLNRLYTVNGEKIKYNRRGSMSVEGINGMIDVYDTFLPSGQPYKTIYINMYGAKKSSKAPNGFVFARSEVATVPTNNVGAPRPNASRNNLPNEHLIFSTNIYSVVLTIVSMFSIVIAMNVQDVKRNDYEVWNPTAVYIILLLIFGAFLGFAINSLLKSRFKLISWLTTIPILATIITVSEGSIMAHGYYNYSDWNYYINSDVVAALNVIWIICIVLVLFIRLVPVIIVAIKTINNIWYRSVSYREKCYKRVAEIHSYFEKGIITEAEYEKAKSDILKHIE